MTELDAALSLALKTELLPAARNWLQTASKEELKGLKVISAVLKNKGAKKFRAQPSDLKSTLKPEEEFKKNQFKSSYSVEFGTGPQASAPNIFQYRKLSDLPCSSTLSPIALRFLEQWISLRDSPVYQQLVLSCLRAIYAVVKSASARTSEAVNSFKWVDPSRNFTSHRIDLVKLERPQTHGNKPWARPETAKPTVNEDAALRLTKEDLQKRVDALRGDHGIFRQAGGTAMPASSEYQRTFVTHFNKYRKPQGFDGHTSIALGRVCPEPHRDN